MSAYLRSQNSTRSFDSNSESFIDPILATSVWHDDRTAANQSFAEYVDANFRQEHNLRHSNNNIAIGVLPEATPINQFKGKRTILPGTVLLLLIILGGIVGVTYFGIEEAQIVQEQKDLTRERINNLTPPVRPIPPPLICGQMDFQTRGNQIEMVSPDGQITQTMTLLGINWSGMENPEGVPHGLAFGQSSIDQIADLLVQNNYNAVRLPLSAMGISENAQPNLEAFVFPTLNPEFISLTGQARVTTYVEMIQQIVISLGKKRIGVVLEIHKIDPEAIAPEDLWFTDDFTVEQYQEILETLASNMCSTSYWNIIGIDLNNEPSMRRDLPGNGTRGACWPTDPASTTCEDATNWQIAASRFGEAVLSQCSNWLIFVQGVNELNKNITLNGQEYFYDDWEGSTISPADTNPVVFTGLSNKVVYAPHFYSPSRFPRSFFFVDSSLENNTFVEFDSSTSGNIALQNNIEAIMDSAFGNTRLTTPLVLGEIGGLFGDIDIGPHQTSTRSISSILNYTASNLAGGFIWSLNPDSMYDFNGVYNPLNPTQFGLGSINYRSLREEYQTTIRNTILGTSSDDSEDGDNLLPCFDI